MLYLNDEHPTKSSKTQKLKLVPSLKVICLLPRLIIRIRVYLILIN